VQGRIHVLSEDGLTLVETLGLDDDDYNSFREAILDLLNELPQTGKSYSRFFGYPATLPDLSKESKPPKGNKRPGGIQDSFFEKSKRAILPQWY